MPTGPGAKVKFTDRRIIRDFAECMRDLVDLQYPKAQLIRGSTICRPTRQTLGLPRTQVHRILRRLEVRYTSKHASE
jgi:hypothetical protein